MQLRIFEYVCECRNLFAVDQLFQSPKIQFIAG